MKGNKGLLDKKRFEKIEKEKELFLKNLALKRGIRIFESLTSAETLNEFKGNFSPDNPVCLKITLMRQRSEIASRSI
jgi:hypothetical protein